jgi:hypothetical protein
LGRGRQGVARTAEHDDQGGNPLTRTSSKLIALAMAGSMVVFGACSSDEDVLKEIREGAIEGGATEEQADCIEDYMRDNVENISDKNPDDADVQEAFAGAREECATAGAEEEGTEEEVDDEVEEEVDEVEEDVEEEVEE